MKTKPNIPNAFSPDYVSELKFEPSTYKPPVMKPLPRWARDTLVTPGEKATQSEITRRIKFAEI